MDAPPIDGGASTVENFVPFSQLGYERMTVQKVANGLIGQIGSFDMRKMADLVKYYQFSLRQGFFESLAICQGDNPIFSTPGKALSLGLFDCRKGLSSSPE